MYDTGWYTRTSDVTFELLAVVAISWNGEHIIRTISSDAYTMRSPKILQNIPAELMIYGPLETQEKSSSDPLWRGKKGAHICQSTAT